MGVYFTARFHGLLLFSGVVLVSAVSSAAPEGLGMRHRPAAAPASAPASAPGAHLPLIAVSRPTPSPRHRQRRTWRGGARGELRGTLAVVNLGRVGARGWRVAARLRQAFSSWAGGWARQPGIADHLLGVPQAQVLPSNESGQELGEILDRLRRGGRPATGPLWHLGRLLGVDYLLVLRVRPSGMSARLFSVHRQRWAPQGYEHTGHSTAPLRAYILDQVGVSPLRGPKGERSSWHKEWWVWAIAGALAAVTLGFALAQSDTDQGKLHIIVSR